MVRHATKDLSRFGPSRRRLDPTPTFGCIARVLTGGRGDRRRYIVMMLQALGLAASKRTKMGYVKTLDLDGLECVLVPKTAPSSPYIHGRARVTSLKSVHQWVHTPRPAGPRRVLRAISFRIFQANPLPCSWA